MNPPTDDTELKPEKLEEEKESGASFHCDLYDADVVRKIAQEFLPGLASACVDNTTGGLFRSPASVAVDIRREMVDYLIQRSENFVAESVVLDGTPNEEISDNPHDIISDLVDDFSSSKRNFFSRVSGWLLSEKREDRIDDFVQEMEINGFWLLNRRESVAQTLLKNVDFKNMYHCNMSFKSQQELEEHKMNCGFRTMTCSNEGCDSIFSFTQMENHDSSCPFKILKCEQNCEEYIMRREMDRHCITVCPMKLVKCPFHSVGCQSSVPQCTIEQHRSENLSSHLLYVLQVVHKEASVEDLKERAEELIKISSPPGNLAAARDARSLTHQIKGLEAKLPPLKVTTSKTSDVVNNSTDKKAENTDVATRHVRFEDPPSENKETANLPSIADGSQEKKLEDSQTNNNNSVQESLRESPIGKENSSAKPKTPEAHTEKLSEQKAGELAKHESLKSQVKSEGETKKEKHDDSVSEKKAGEPVRENPKSPINSEKETKGGKHNDSASAEKKVDEPVKQENLTSPIKAEEKPNREKQDDSASAEKKVDEPVKQENLKSPIEAEADSKEVKHNDSVAAEKKVDDSLKQENPRSPVKAETDIQKEKDDNPVGAEKKVDKPVKQENSKSPIKAGEETNREKHDDSAASDKKVHEKIKQESSTSPIKAEEHLQNKTNAGSASAEKIQMEKSSDEKAGAPIKHESLTSPAKAEEHMQRETNAGSASAEKVRTEKPSEEKAGVPVKHENTTPPIKAEEHTKGKQLSDPAASEKEESTKIREKESTN